MSIWETLGYRDPEQAFELHDAVAAGDAAKIRRLIAEGADVNQEASVSRVGIYGEERHTWTPLELLIVVLLPDEIKTEIAMLLLDAGVPVNGRRRYCSPLLTAAYYRDEPLTRILLERGANVAVCDYQDRGPLYLAVRGIHEEMPAQRPDWRCSTEQALRIMTLLLDAGVDPNADPPADYTTALHAAVQEPDMVRLLLARGANPRILPSPHVAPLLKWAVQKEARDTLPLLIAAGLDIDEADRDGRSLLRFAACDHWIWDENEDDAKIAISVAETVRVLVGLGAEIDRIDPESGKTILFDAVRAGNPACVQVLLDLGADPHHLDADGLSAWFVARDDLDSGQGKARIELLRILEHAGAAEPPEMAFTDLHIALLWEQSAAALRLLAEGADPNARDARGRTPLHDAARFSRDRESVRALLDHGADVNARGENGRTPLMIAAERGSAGIVALLLEAGANVNDADDDGKTPLMFAAGDPAVVRLLLDHAADFWADDKYGHSAMYYAVRAGCSESRWSLLIAGADIVTDILDDANRPG